MWLCIAVLYFSIFQYWVLLRSVFWKDKTYHWVLTNSERIYEKNELPLKWWKLSSIDPKWMFTGPAHSVMHCVTSVLRQRRHALFLSDTKGSSQIGFVLLVLPADRYVDVISSKESEFNALITHTIRLLPLSYNNRSVIVFRCISCLNLQ